MADYTLTAVSPLGGFCKTFADTELSEVTDRAIISMAIPEGGEAAFAKKISSAYSCEVPNPGQSVQSPAGDSRLLWMQRDQFFLLSEYTDHNVTNDLQEKLDGTAYLSDQSDSLVLLRLNGPQCVAALERICPIDLYSESFPVNAVSRTTMEHMAAVVIKEGENSFILMGLRSYAHSFLHALDTSLTNITA